MVSRRFAQKNLLRFGLCISITLAGSACATSYSAFEVDRQLSKAMGAAQYHLNIREGVEAAQLARAVERIDSDYPGLKELQGELGEQVTGLFDPSPIGSNRRARYQIERSLGERIARYLPDRLADAIDVISVDAHSGLGGYGAIHLTHGLRVSAGARVVGGVGLYSPRNWPGFQLQANAGGHLIAAGAENFSGFTAGPAGVYGGTHESRGPNRPLDRIFQDLQDYWAIGGSATVGFFGGGAEFHPVQALDFVLGLVTIDIANDDSARTRSLRLLRSEREIIQVLAEMESSDGLMKEYRAKREEFQKLQR